MVSAVGLGAFATDTARQLNILGHDGHTLGVDGAKIRVLEKTDQVSLGRFLRSQKQRFDKHLRPSWIEYPQTLKHQISPQPTTKITWRAPMAADWKRRSVLKSWAISRTNRWKGSLRIRSSVDVWYLRSEKWDHENYERVIVMKNSRLEVLDA